MFVQSYICIKTSTQMKFTCRNVIILFIVTGKTCDHWEGPHLGIKGAVTVVTEECATLKLV